MPSPLASVASALCFRVSASLARRAGGVPSVVTRPSLLASVHTPLLSPLGGVRFATSKAGGSTKNGRDSQPKYLGVKKYGGQYVEPGNIIIRQRGQRYGIVDSTQTVALGRDHTIYALMPGYVRFWWHAMRKKFYLEVVQSPPTDLGPIAKYPIVRLKDWELPSLLALPADTRVDPGIIDRLLAWIGTLNTAQKLAAVPRGVPLVGGVERVAWPTMAVRGRAAAAGAASAVPPLQHPHGDSEGGGRAATAAEERLSP